MAEVRNRAGFGTVGLLGEDLQELSHAGGLWALLCRRHELGKPFLQLWVVVQEDDVGLRNVIQEESLLLLDVLEQNGLLPVQLHRLKDIDVVGPKANLDGLEGVPNQQPNHVSLLLESARILVANLVLDILDHSNHVHQVAIDPFTVMLPAIVFVLVLRLHCLVLDLVDLVLLVFQADLRTQLRLLAVEELKTTD